MASTLCKLAVACLLICVVLTASVNAAAPKLVNYQGRLTSGGNPVNDGVYTVRFRVYTDSTGGTSLWEETQPVQTKDGLFSAILGSSTAMADTLFNSPNRFLGIKVNLDDEISPRSRLVSSPYALATPYWTASTLGHAVRPGPVGIGVSNPGAMLHVLDTYNNYMAARFGTSNSEASYIELYNPGVNQAWSLGIAGPSGAFAATLPRKSFYIYQNPLGHLPLAIDSMGHVGMGGGSGSAYTSSDYQLMVNGHAGRDGIRAFGNYIGILASTTQAGAWAVGGITYSNSASAIGVYGYAEYGRAGSFLGNVQVTGTLSKSAGSFKIDHPLDPANKYLSHSFVESPDMMNIYNGNLTTDVAGNATVTLPDWFDALNRDFRYQLTVIGQFAQAIVASEIINNQFAIKTDKPNVKVSWQVTGVRQDAYANAHRIPIEEDKPAAERGHYQHPELFGQPEEKGIEWARHPEMMKQTKAERLKPMTADGR